MYGPRTFSEMLSDLLVKITPRRGSMGSSSMIPAVVTAISENLVVDHRSSSFQLANGLLTHKVLRSRAVKEWNYAAGKFTLGFRLIESVSESLSYIVGGNWKF